MSHEAFLKKAIGALDSVGISYMVCGSLSSSFHGEPRATILKPCVNGAISAA